ncbi:hypothetical protein HPP92_023901 [Vanilla planifolia]|uniref:VAN3-binding protein-like auxin canalisation domain-containing protein n=1 Tax=Vanilla planifolia TaxID=51239 RepID=A0A835PJX2_VANPL|nr:hypothetical protein HPP92_023901 [Vanilla planifolia]
MGYCGVRFGREFGGLPLLLENVKEDDGTAPPPETPTETMEFLARSWSLSATELSKALGDALPPTSSRDLEDCKFLRGAQRGKTMTGWLKDNKERRRSEARTRGAQIYAAISVAGVAAVVAATASGPSFSPIPFHPSAGAPPRPAPPWPRQRPSWRLTASRAPGRLAPADSRSWP